VIKTVHQILFNDGGDAQLDGYALAATRSVRKIFSDHEYKLWLMDDAEQFIESHFDPSLLAAFRTLEPYSYKADLFKFCLLKQQGGWIVDLGVKMLKLPTSELAERPDPDFIVFRSSSGWDPLWNLSLALVYAKPGHPALDTAIDWVVEHCRTRYYGGTPLMPTMANFGRALTHHSVHENVLVGNVVDVRWRSYKRGFRLNPLGLVAARKPPSAKAGNLSNIGVSGTNNYVHLWRNRQVYGEREDGGQRTR